MTTTRSTLAAGALRRTAVALCVVAGAAAAQADGVRPTSFQTLALLTRAQGTNPGAALVTGPDGLLYGTTTLSGANGFGGIFRVEADGSTTLLHAFAADHSDGWNPAAALLLAADGWLYGSTESGGPGRRGVLFKISTAGEYVIVHSFSTADGGLAWPSTALIQDGAGNFYGTVTQNAHFHGAVFEMSPDYTITVLHRFADVNDGAVPSGLVLASDGTLYGTTTTSHGLAAGTVFRIPPGGVLRTLHSFVAASEGCSAGGALVTGPDDAVYGTAVGCGSGHGGTIFRVAFDGDFTVLHTFDPLDPLGYYPLPGLTQDADGRLYGANQAGGVVEAGQQGGGTVYAISRQGEARRLHQFVYLDQTGGFWPAAMPTWLPDDRLVGPNMGGGAPDAFGTVYGIQLAH